MKRDDYQAETHWMKSRWIWKLAKTHIPCVYIVFKLSVVPERSFIFHLLRPHYNNLQSLLYFYTLISSQYTECTYYNPRSIETARKMCKICKNSNMITTSIPPPLPNPHLASYYSHFTLTKQHIHTHKNAIFIIFHPFLVFISLFYSNTGNTAASWCCCWCWWCWGRREGSRQFYYIF